MLSDPLDPASLVFRNTAARPGRHLAVTPDNSAMRHLHYGRIRLNDEQRSLRFDTEQRETALIVLRGNCRVSVGAHTEALAHYDALYIPRGSSVEVSSSVDADILECGAPVEGDYPLQHVRYEDVQREPSLCFTTGSSATTRQLNILIGKNVNAGRLVAGFTRSEPGHWTSWPPHEHADLLEEMYVYFDMPDPAFGIQLVYTDTRRPELAAIVRDGDAVLMPKGYHPNTSVPGHAVSFVWLMAAHREVQDRVFGVVNVQPDFKHSGSGLEASLR
ncbi:MAG TPA: 5-deoxy-glucuronate isomerase [Polyangiaceae bacterium]|nr:5-deoxy-glucuronate isomerase [Polyangiaceae bacterium]